MCELYSYRMTPAEMRALGLHYRFRGTAWTEWADRQHGRNEPIEDVHPNERAPVVVLRNGQHVVGEEMLWGFPKYAGAYGINFRTLNNPRWKPWLNRGHRCVVPAIAFAGADRNAPGGHATCRWFMRADKLPFVFAGIWRPWTGDRGTETAPNIGNHALFSIMAAEPNAVVAPVHEQAMPVVLMTAEEVGHWLNGESVQDALAMQKPAADEAFVAGRPVKPEKKGGSANPREISGPAPSRSLRRLRRLRPSQVGGGRNCETPA